MSRILFVTYGGGHIEEIMPVMRALAQRQPDAELVLFALTTAYKKAADAGFNPLGYKDFLHLVDKEAVLRTGERLSRDNAHPSVDPLETYAYIGTNYIELVERHGEEEAARIYAASGRYGFLPVNFMQKVIAHVEPDVLVTTTSPRSEYAALHAASSLGVPSVCIYNLFGNEGAPFVDREIRADRICVLSASVKRRLTEQGFEADRIVVTGNPAFDALHSPEAKAAANRFLDEKGWHSLMPILWAGYKEPSEEGLDFPLEIEDMLRQYTERNPNVALMIRYHPSCWHLYPKRAPSARIHFSQTPYEALAPLILASKVVVVQNSTVGLEAASGGKPIVSLEHAPHVKSSYSYARLGLSIPCHSTDELPAILTRVLSDPGSTSIGLEYGTNGAASERVAEVVSSAVERRTGRSLRRGAVSADRKEDFRSER